MGNQAEHTTLSATDPVEQAANAVRAEALRALLRSIPPAQLAAVIELVRDDLPASLFKRDRAPQRGGDVLKNVFELFKSEPTVKRAAPDVVEALAKKGKAVEATPVRQALNYLNSRRILRRVGYGLYQLEDGSIVETPFA